MPAPSTREQFLDVVRKSGLLEESALSHFLASQTALPDDPAALATAMVQAGLVTHFQAKQLRAGRSRGFIIDSKYKLLEFLGAGGMGTVYLCEHTSMKRLVALKVLPADLATDGSYMERFYREARAVARLDHPNIVRAFDVDHDPNHHFLVMEYVDGSSLQQIVQDHGPLDPVRAAHYISQAAWGLQHAHEAGLVHRDIKPGNLLLDRHGTIKLLDLGLARFSHEDDGLSKKYDESVLGTTDYLSPEQVVDGKVDIRADIYSLGATFYFLLTGQTLFGEGKTAAKLVWQQVRKPKPIREHRPEVPAALARIIENQMLAKHAQERFQVPAEVCEALEPWTENPIAPPPEAEMPSLCPAVRAESHASSLRTPAPSGTISRTAIRSALARTALTTGSTVMRGKSPSGAPRTNVDTDAVRDHDTTDEPRPREQPSRAGDSKPRRKESFAKNVPMFVAVGIAIVVSFICMIASVWWAIASLIKGAADPNMVIVQDAPPALPPGRPFVNKGPGGPPPTVVRLMTEPAGHRVRTPAYEALVGNDGNLSSFKTGGVELFKPGTRGSYFYYTQENAPGIVKLPTIQTLGANVLKAVGDRFTVIYQFDLDSVTLKLTNATDHRVPFYIVFDRTVSTVVGGQGEKAATPVSRDWPTTTWFAGKSRIGITGGTRIVGPLPTAGGLQAVEATLATYETRNLTLKVGTVSDAEVPKLTGAVIRSAPRRIETPAYDIVVEADGCLTSLSVNGSEFLRPGVDVSRGLYLHNGKGPVVLPEIDQPQKDLINAKGADGSIRYEFAPDSITCTATNTSKGNLSFFAVFDPAVVALRDGAGEWSKLPISRNPGGPEDKRFEKTTWFTPRARLEITGGSRVWGPWSAEKLQVWEASLKPNETRRIVLRMAPPSSEEAAKVAELVGPAVPRSDISVRSPGSFQVFQRQTRFEGPVRLQGRVNVPCDRLEARLTGESLQGPLPDRWQEIPLTNPARTFNHVLKTPAGGWYKLELRGLAAGKEVATTVVEKVGVGEVFVTAGQSNSTNCSPDKLEQTTGKVATFDGYRWRIANDPQPGVHDRSTGGSCWPAFGDALAQRYRVPIGIASAGHSGTSINQWQPGGELFNWLLTRTHQLGPRGFRAVLWHQGESDVGMSADDYARRLGNLIRSSRQAADWDMPWFVARVSYHNPQNTSFPSTRDAQKKLWDTGVALEGPDTDTLTGDNRSENGRGIHFSAKGSRAHGQLWADKVGTYLDRVLQK